MTQPQIQPQSNQHLQQPNTLQQDHPYVIVNYGQQRFRIRSLQYQAHQVTIVFWELFWSAISLIIICGLVTSLLVPIRIGGSIVSGVGALLNFGLSLYLIYNYKQVSYVTIGTFLNISIFLTIITALLAAKIQFLVIAIGFFALSEITISCYFLISKAFVIPKLIVIIQLLIIALKLDESIKISWQATLFGLVAIFFLSLVGFLIVVPYLIVNATIYYQQEQKFKVYGLVLLGMLMLAFATALSIPISMVYFGLDGWIMCVVSLVVNLGLILHLKLNWKHIVVFLSQLEISKPFNLVISIKKIEDEHFLGKSLVRLSENWFTFEEKAKEQQKQQTEEDIKNTKKTQCLVCLQAQPNTIWMPCGHLASCTKCFKALVEKKCIQCLLCKNIPEQILTVEASKQSPNKLVIKQGLSIRAC